MNDEARSADNLQVGELRGARAFRITWRSGRRRHRLLLGGEREDLGERTAPTAVRLILAWPAPPAPEVVESVVRWVLILMKERPRG
jgi:hypothetical protein